MATATTVPTTRAEIFKQGLKDATGTITFWRVKWGTITLDGPLPVEYFVSIDAFSSDDRDGVVGGCRVIFDVAGGQADMKYLNLPEGTKPRKAKASSARLMNFNR